MLIRLLRRFLRGYWLVLVGVVLLQGVQALASLYLPDLNASVIDKGVLRGDTGYIERLGVVMLVVTAVQLAFSIGAVYLGSRVSMGLGRDVRRDLFRQVTGFSAQEVNRFGAPSLITRITNDVQQVQMLVLMTSTLAVAAPVTAVGGLVLALRQAPSLSWLLAVSLPVLVAGLVVIVSRMVPQFRFMQERIDGVNRVLREQITGIRVVRAFVREPEETHRFGTVNDGLTATSLRAGRLMAVMFPFVMLVINGSSVAVVWFGGDRIAAGDVTIGSLIAFLSYFTLILTSVMMATFVAVLTPRAAVSAERIGEVLDTAVSVRAPAVPRTVPSLAPLELRDVGFHYPGADAPVLTGVSFTAVAGQTMAVVGSTGSGKTTLVNLVARLIDVTSGAVLMGGVDIRELDPDLLWHRIGLIPQRAYLFSGTVRTNLEYGRPGAGDDELWEALRVAQAADFVAAMPGGLDAPIEQGGTNVSGGQRQRLAIARALVRRPDIYLFDDSFSALDVATDARLRAALRPYTSEAAVVVVAQRVSTIRDADQILVLDHGTPVRLGRHEELLASCPCYVEIVDSQRQERAA